MTPWLIQRCPVCRRVVYREPGRRCSDCAEEWELVPEEEAMLKKNETYNVVCSLCKFESPRMPENSKTLHYALTISWLMLGFDFALCPHCVEKKTEKVIELLRTAIAKEFR